MAINRRYFGFINKETICTEEVSDVRDLIDRLESFCLGVGQQADVVYVENGETNNVTLRLVKNTLTDGSHTYDVRIS